MKLPHTRENLIVQELNDEVMVYNLTTDKYYCLNSTTKTVFEACDGEMTIEELKRQSNLPEEVIYLSLDEIKRNELLKDDYISPLAGMNRREVIKRAGIATMIVLPVITGLVAPKAVNAASPAACFASGATFTPNTGVCTGLTCIALCSQEGITRCCTGAANTAVINIFTNNTCTCA